MDVCLGGGGENGDCDDDGNVEVDLYADNGNDYVDDAGSGAGNDGDGGDIDVGSVVVDNDNIDDDVYTNVNKINNVMCWNVQGLKSKLLSASFKQFCSNYDIFALSEINNCQEAEMSRTFTCYDIIPSKRNVVKGGGVAVFIKKKLRRFVKRIETKANECVFLHVNKSALDCTSDLIMCFPYIAHEHSNVYINQQMKGIELLENYVLNVCDRYGDLPLLIGGDFNARTGLISDTLQLDNGDEFIPSLDGLMELFDEQELPERSSQDKEINNFGKQLIQLCKIHGLYILNGRTKGDRDGKITCIANKGRSIVDYIIASHPLHNIIRKFEVIPRIESDHFPLSMQLTEPQATAALQEVPDRHFNLTPMPKFKWDDRDKEHYVNNLEISLNANHDKFIRQCEERNLDEAVSTVNNCIKESIKPRNNKHHQKPQPSWFDQDCENHKQLKYKTLNQFHKTNTATDLEIYLKARREFRAICREKKREYHKEQAQLVIENSLKPHSKDFWKQVKSLTNTKQTYSNDIPGYKWQEYFRNLLNPENVNLDTTVTESDISCPTGERHDQGSDDMMNGPITESEIKSAMKKLKAGKACGPDGISPEYYMLQLPSLVTYLLILFNAVFDSGIYPQEWTTSAIVPLHKKGDTNNIDNYRGISLINVLSKIFSHVLNARLTTWCDLNNLIPEAQAGFRSSYSTIDNIFVLQCLVQKYIGRARGRFYVFYVDFFKAFDWVNRKKLWYVLSKHGCNGNMINILKSMYNNVSTAVRVMESTNSSNTNAEIGLSKTMCITDYFKCLSGVKQGCVLSPILFSIFISEFEKELRDSNFKGIELLTNDDVHAFSLLYADDLVLFADTVLDMQKKIRFLEIFCEKWNLKVNVNKSKMMVFRNGGYIKRTEKWVFCNKPIEVATYYSYLGLLISSRLCWSKCIDNQSCKAIRAIYCVGRMLRNLKYIGLSIAVKIFDVKIKPILLYGSEIWGTKIYDAVEYAQIKFFKNFLGVGKTTENCYILREVGRYPLWVETKTRAVKYWCKLLYLSDNRYPRKCYIQQYRHAELGRKNWASEIRYILSSTGFAYVWTAQHVGDQKQFLRELKQRLIDISFQEQDSIISRSNCKYLEYHPYQDVANYINTLGSLKQRRILTLLRTRSLPINNNMARISIVKSNVCSRCTSGEIDDEFHFLFACSALNDLRLMHIPASHTVHVSFDNLCQIYNSRNHEFLLNLCMYVEKSLYSNTTHVDDI